MAKNIFNWIFSDIVVRDRGFIYSHARGSHHFYTGNFDNQEGIVCVPFHGSKALKPNTFKAIVVQSGIPLKDWLK
jgi:predicted RNA binding protein YcfA (HicA-like mRNA interferase family)